MEWLGLRNTLCLENLKRHKRVCVGVVNTASLVVLSHTDTPDHRALADVGVNQFKGMKINQRPWESPQG